VIVGISRIRNEALILEDTLRHFAGHCDRLVIYDDYSTDESPEIAASFDRVDLICGEEWSPDQPRAETRHRAIALDYAREHSPDMVLCFDADERIEGQLPDKPGGYRMALFDGYMTPDRRDPYTGGRLEDLPRMWGPERRDILMLFEPHLASYRGYGKREPDYSGQVVDSGLKVRHYGKCLSVEHWEDTCDFYARYFPRLARKWQARKGKAIHDRSDFGAPLIEWEQCE